MLLASLDTWSKVSDIASNFATMVALLVGGLWAYVAFVRERTRWPRAEVDLAFSERRLDDEFTLVNVTVRIKNDGRGLMQITRIRADLRRVLPLDEDMPAKIRAGDQYGENRVQAQWPLLKRHERIPPGRIELEPGETDEFGFDFFVEPATEVVQAYAFVANVAKKGGKRPLGWGVTELHDIAVNSERNGNTMTIASGPKEEQEEEEKR